MCAEEKVGWAFFALIVMFLFSVVAMKYIELANEHELLMELVVCEATT